MDPLEPEHMDRWSRNRRLYETLKGTGLYVVPIPEDHDPGKIRELIASADLPADVTGIGMPVVISCHVSSGLQRPSSRSQPDALAS